MIIFAKTDLQRIAFSAVGALLLSTASVVAAVSPAKAAEANAPFTLGDWQAQVERQIDGTLRMPAHVQGTRNLTMATVRVRFDANGHVSNVRIAQSTGERALDREAIRTAKTIAFPALPSGFRGRPQTVEMRLFFGNSPSDVIAAAGSHRTKHAPPPKPARPMSRPPRCRKAERCNLPCVPVRSI